MRVVQHIPTVISGQGLPSFLWLLAFLLLCGSTLAQTPHEARSGAFFLTNADGLTQAALHIDTDVTMDITGMTARVNLRQTFTNDTAHWQEGRYVFPLPDDSAVNALRMLVGEREIIGEVRERDEAKREYEQARSDGRKAALVEQQRPNLFTQQLANIAPGETITIDLQYIQALHYEEGRFRLRFPMTLTPRDGVDTARASVDDNSMSLLVRLDAGLPLTRAGSTTHDLQVFAAGNRPGRVEMRPRAGRVLMDRDLELEWAPKANAAPQAAVFVDTRDEGTFMQLMLLPPRVDAPVTTLGREILIVLDSSGSMDGNAIVQAKQSVQLALNGLRPGDWFNIVDFDDSFRTLFPASLPASADNVQRARRFVGSVQADGGTEMLPALQFALTQAPPVVQGQDVLQQVVFVTDGAVGNEDEMFRLIDAELGDARLFTVGIGSAPNSYFMRKAATVGRGSYTFIDDTKRVTERMSALLRELENAVMAELAVEWPAGVVAEFFPEQIPDLYLGEPLFLTARLTGALASRHDVVVSGTIAGENWQQRVHVDVDAHASTAGAPPSLSSLATYWARQKIDALLDKRFSGNGSDPTLAAKLRQHVLDVALPYQLLSPYTSFIAAEQRVSRPTDTALGASAATSAHLSAAQMTQLAYPATATPAGAWLLAGSLALLCAALSLLTLRREKELVRA